MKRSGFTLIELLVVIAIIALLLSIIGPALRSSRELGKRIVCMNNQKTIGIANVLYADAHDGWYVPIIDRRDGIDRYWPMNLTFRELMGYMDMQSEGEIWVAPKELLCPSDIISNKEIKDPMYDAWLSYGGNITDWYLSWWDILYAGHRDTLMKNPSRELAFSESNDWWLWWVGADYVRGWDVLGQDTIMPYKEVGCDGPILYRHNEGAVLIFYDGHVEWWPKEKVFVQEDWDQGRPGIWSVFPSYPPPEGGTDMP